MAQSFDTGLKSVAAHYLRLLGAKVTITSMQKQLEENPNYPTLLSLSEAFSKYHIPNDAFEVLPEDFDQVESPFVAFTEIPNVGTDFVLVTKNTKSSIQYLYKSKIPRTVTTQEFLKRYKQVVWAAEPTNRSEENGYVAKRADEKKSRNKTLAWWASLFILMLSAFLLNTGMGSPLSSAAIYILKSAGLLTSILLLVYEIDRSNTFVKTICGVGSKTNCDAVLSSKAAKVLGISWGEIGFFYFAGTTLFLLLPSVGYPAKVALISMTNIVATPYILFSVYYQWRVVKQWCPLCLTVQVILFSELIWSLFNFWLAGRHLTLIASNILHFHQVLAFGFCLLLPIVAWFKIKPLAIKAKDMGNLSAAHKRLQYNPEIFNSLLTQQPKLPEGWQNLGITLGNPDAKNVIVKVCNPYCQPCSRAHPDLEALVKDNNNIKVKMIFVNSNNDSDKGSVVAKHLLAIAEQGNSKKTEQALDDWYLAKKKNYQLFSEKYPLVDDLKRQDENLEIMSNWCNEAKIFYTPAIYVNGNRLPELYQIGELKNIL